MENVSQGLRMFPRWYDWLSFRFFSAQRKRQQQKGKHLKLTKLLCHSAYRKMMAYSIADHAQCDMSISFSYILLSLCGIVELVSCNHLQVYGSVHILWRETIAINLFVAHDNSLSRGVTMHRIDGWAIPIVSVAMHGIDGWAIHIVRVRRRTRLVARNEHFLFEDPENNLAPCRKWEGDFRQLQSCEWRILRRTHR